MLIYWEMTRACDLACRHCRAEAAATADPMELTEAEGRQMITDALSFGAPLPQFVFTGGDPFKRADLFRLIEHARLSGFGVSLAPSGTPLLTRERVQQLAAIGIDAMSLSFDGATAERHDAFRGVPGCFDLTVRAAGWIREAGLPLQINTLVTRETMEDLPALAQLLVHIGITRWSLFFLISVGRGRRGLTEVTPLEAERLSNWLYDLSRTAPYAVKTTEAMHFRRVAVKRMRARGMDAQQIARTPLGRGFGIRDGNGIMFVSHRGEVYPSGFLPLHVGNVRYENIASIYQGNPVFQQLRDVRLFKGKCGVCPFLSICGGSRARAYAVTGDYLAEDPLCAYQPQRAAVEAP